MSELSGDSLRFAVAELLIKKIGEALGINSIRNFDKEQSSPRAYYLGENPITKRLHWIFINDSYKISAFDKLPQSIRKKLSGKVLRNVIRREDAVELLRETAQNVLIVDPTRFLESEETPQSHRVDKESGKPILPLPEIYINENRKMKKNAILRVYKNKLGLSMTAFAHNKLCFSPYAILDPRSYAPGYWDVLLGVETTIYLPIELRGTPIGVLFISQDIETAEIPGWDKAANLANLHDKIDIDEKLLRIKSLYKYLTEDVAKSYETSLRKKWRCVKNSKEIRSGVELLHFLFENLVNYYNEYTFNFDDAIIRRNLETRNKELRNTLKKLRNREQSAVEVITDYMNSLKLPTFQYRNKLRRVEPLLQSIGKKEHDTHMFNVFLLGRVLWKYLFKNFPNSRLWQAIALSHDITYPIEAIEEEIEEFFEAYFHNKKTPRCLISNELFYSYGEFGKFLQKLINKTSQNLSFSQERREIFEDLVLSNLYARRDHAVLSALFTLMCFVRNNKSEDYAYKVAIPIFLHNLYQWKFYACKEINDFVKRMPASKVVTVKEVL